MSRVVHLVALDEAGRLLLTRRPGEASWGLPALGLKSSDSYATAVRRLLCKAAVEFVCVGASDGRRWAAPGPGARVEQHFQLARVRGDAPKNCSHHRWAMLQQIRSHSERWSELRRLAEGYLQGWIPDGPIRLEWD
ncbi:NUDIX domain-containing protein [Streptomyces peucetius]